MFQPSIFRGVCLKAVGEKPPSNLLIGWFLLRPSCNQLVPKAALMACGRVLQWIKAGGFFLKKLGELVVLWIFVCRIAQAKMWKIVR